MSSEYLNTKWWVTNGKKIEGPFTIEEIRNWNSSTSDDLPKFICPIGGDQWRSFSSFPQILDENVNTEKIILISPPIPIIDSDQGESKSEKEKIEIVTIASKVINKKWSSEERILITFGVLLATLFFPLFFPYMGKTPQSSLGFAFVGAGYGMILLNFLIRPREQDLFKGVGAFIFSFILSLPILFMIQNASIASLDSKFILHGNKKVIISEIIIRMVGYAYKLTFNPEQDGVWFVTKFFCMFVSVAFCEELVKLLPVILLCFYLKSLNLKLLIFAGALSGLGFGIQEGIWYHNTEYLPRQVPLTIYYVRFFTCAMLHACWASISTGFFVCYFNNKFDEIKHNMQFNTWCVVIFSSILWSMMLHTLYNTLSEYSIFLVMIVILMTFISTAVVIAGHNK